MTATRAGRITAAASSYAVLPVCVARGAMRVSLCARIVSLDGRMDGAARAARHVSVCGAAAVQVTSASVLITIVSRIARFHLGACNPRARRAWRQLDSWYCMLRNEEWGIGWGIVKNRKTLRNSQGRDVG